MVRAKAAETRRKEKAAIKLQAVERGNMVRAKAAKEKAAKEKAAQFKKKREAAAIKLQTANRGKMARAKVAKLKNERNEAIKEWRGSEVRAPKDIDIHREIYNILAMNNAKDAVTKINKAFRKGSGHTLNVAKFIQLLDLKHELSTGKNKYTIEDTRNYISAAPDYKGNKNIDPDTFDAIHKYLLAKIVGKIQSIGEAFDNAKSIESKKLKEDEAKWRPPTRGVGLQRTKSNNKN